MRPSKPSQIRMSRWPKKLAANTPVTNRITKLSNDAEPGNVKADQRFRAQRFRHEQQRLVERGHEKIDHPDRDAERHPDEQAGDQIALHRTAGRGATWRQE